MNRQQKRKVAKAASNTSKITATYRIDPRIHSHASANALAKGTTLSAVIRETVTIWAQNK